jgi:8-oxo-dGTP diphosphatase
VTSASVPDALEVLVPGTETIAAAVIADGGGALLVRRRVAEGTLSWRFPAGKVEPGETAEEAAVREAREETGIESEASYVLGSRVHPVTARRVIYVACRLVSGTPRVAASDEISAVTWCPISDIRSYVPAGVFGPAQEYLDAMLGS